MGLEQRQHKRYLVKDNVFIALENCETRVGSIEDLSEGGSAVKYISDEFIPMDGQVKLNIFVSGNHFRLSGIPCNVIYDKPADNTSIERGVYVPNYLTMRCGVRFKSLTNKQHEQLLFLIDTHNAGTTP